MEVMGAVDTGADKELVVAEDGSIPAEQLARLGVRPGAHLRVVEASQPGPSLRSIIKDAISHCPVQDAVARAVPITVEFDSA